MKLLYAEGAAIAVIAPFIAYFLEVFNLSVLNTVFLSLALLGIWTIASALVFTDSKERLYFLVWGLLLISVSTALVLPLQYAAALILAVIIGLIVYSAATRKNGKSKAVANKSPSVPISNEKPT